MKKILFAACLTMSNVSLANDATQNFNGFYLGAGAGFSAFKTNQQFQFDSSKVTNPTRFSLNQSQRTYNAVGQVYAGYGRTFNALYLAGELSADIGNPASSYANRDIRFELKQNYAFSGRVKAGAVYKQFLFYGLVGLGATELKNTVQFAPGGLYNSNTMFLRDVEQKRSMLESQVGAGVNWLLNKNLALQIEYSHHFYNSVNAQLNHRIITFPGFNPIGSNEAKSSSDQVTAGLRYIFNA